MLMCFSVQKKKHKLGKNPKKSRRRERDDLQADPIEPDKLLTYFDYQVSSSSCLSTRI